MKKNVLILPIFLICGILSSCQENVPEIKYNDIEKERIEIPVLENVDNIINCRISAFTDHFDIQYIYEEENKLFECSTSTMPYTIPCEKSGIYSARVKAISNNENIADSLWSDYIQFSSPLRMAINTPNNLKIENNSIIKFDKVNGADEYEVMINNESIKTFENSITYEFLPGITYQIKVRALVEPNNYTKNSDWSNSVEEFYTITLPSPTNITYDNGKLSWNSEININGFVVTCTNSSTLMTNDFEVKTNSFNLTSLDSGSYTIKIKTKGIGENPDSEYSDSKKAIISYKYNWNSSYIVSNFTSWESARLEEDEGIAKVISGKSYGGIISPTINVDYSTNPLLFIDYKSINYGYLGKYITTNQPDGYYYQGDTLCEKVDEVQTYLLSKYVYGNLPVEVSNGFKILIGFTGAPKSGVLASEIRSIKIGNINII